MSYVLEPYDDALEEILKRGVHTENRTGVAALTVFGMQRRYRIDDRFPILTRRKVWPRSIFAELLWLLSGSTLNSDLQAMGANIWTPWVSEEFEQKHGYVKSALGPIYGFQLRHFGGFYGNGAKKQKVLNHVIKDDGSVSYEEVERQYGDGGFDQLAYMVKTLKEDPDSRRNLFSLWNPKDLAASRLPPCHYTFSVRAINGKLSGMLTQRSCDFPVGVPANIQFYSTLICLLAQQTGLEPYEFVHSTADSHIYCDQIEAVEEYLDRAKPDSPRLEINKAPDIYSYKIDDFRVTDYQPLPAIKIPVAV